MICVVQILTAAATSVPDLIASIQVAKVSDTTARLFLCINFRGNNVIQLCTVVDRRLVCQTWRCANTSFSSTCSVTISLNACVFSLAPSFLSPFCIPTAQTANAGTSAEWPSSCRMILIRLTTFFFECIGLCSWLKYVRPLVRHWLALRCHSARGRRTGWKNRCGHFKIRPVAHYSPRRCGCILPATPLHQVVHWSKTRCVPAVLVCYIHRSSTYRMASGCISEGITKSEKVTELARPQTAPRDAYSMPLQPNLLQLKQLHYVHLL